MIAFLRGVVRALDDDTVVVDVHGIGWLVSIATLDRERLRVGEPAELLIHMVVREEAMQLFGFATAPAKELFLALLTVPGMGPKGALALLSDLEPSAVARAIHDEDVRTLTRAKGIGKRTAELIVVKLRERLPASLLQDTSAPAAHSAGASAEVESALTNLGYRAAEARAAIAAVVERDPGAGADFDGLLRGALGLLRRGGRDRGGAA